MAERVLATKERTNLRFLLFYNVNSCIALALVVILESSALSFPEFPLKIQKGPGSLAVAS